MLSPLLGLVACASNCGRGSIVGAYCEGGVASGRELGGVCMSIKRDVPADDPDAIATLTWFLDSSGPNYELGVHHTGDGAYTLHREGEQRGTARKDGSWFHVTFSKVPVGSRTVVNQTYRLRSDAPGALN
jgi:hypothetical protein